LAKKHDDFDMTRVRIHMYQNEKWGRYHLPWYKKFIEFLKKDFDVEVVNYNTNGETFRGTINLQTPVGQFNNNPPLSDVDFVVENLDNNEFFVLTFTKYFNSQVVHYLKSDRCIGILSAHFSHRYMYDHLKKNNLLHKLDKVHPWFFGFYQEFEVEKYRKLRDSQESLNDKLYFKGGGWKKHENSYRKVVGILHDQEYLNAKTVPLNQYLEELSIQGVAISHYMDLDWFTESERYPGELCYRDIEMMSIGVPYIRVEYKSEIHEAFKPNFHYITIPREDAYLAFDKDGNEGVAKLFIDTYNKVKDDHDFLSFISQNQRKWYDTHMKWPKSAELTVNKLNIKDWIK